MFFVNIVYYVVHIVCEVDVIANSLVLYLPFCSTLNKNFFSLSSLLHIWDILRPLLQTFRPYTCSHSKTVRLYVSLPPRPPPSSSLSSLSSLILLLYWNGQLVWTPALGLYLCVGDRGAGTVSSGIYRPPFCAVGTNVRRWLSYSHWQAYIHCAFIRQMASFLVSDSLTLGV